MDGLDSEALAIVEESLAFPPGGARDDLVRARTAGNAPLRQRVENLLSHTSGLDTENFLPPAPAPVPLPECVGPFRIIGKIADGGMGVVARGERRDGVYAQIVAIKFIRGDLREGAARDRFEAERRILARLDHPSIARIVDGGSEEGQLWLAMEYVDGLALNAALDAAGATLGQRLTAFLSVCDAIAFAHRNFIVHADIKPGNILMRGDGAIKLLDFGIARLIEDLDEGDDAAKHPLTPQFAAPERSSGGAPTIAGDVYSLGIVLREILPVPRDADLDAIAARATATDPAERYSDVAGLVADIRAWLGHFPVAARANPGWLYLAGKFLRRHRLGAGVTGGVMLLLAAAAILATLLYVRAEIARGEAERRFLEVRDLSQFMLFDLYDSLADSPGTVASRARLADVARRYLERLQQVPDAPVDLKLDIARGWRRLAAVEGLAGVSSLGRPQEARQALDRAEDMTRAILAERPDEPAALEEMGWIVHGRWTLASDSAASATLPGQAAGWFARALRIVPGSPGARLGLLTARKNRGFDLIRMDRAHDAVTLLRDTLANLRARRFEGAMAREARALEVNILGRLGDAVYYDGDVAGSLPWYREQDAIVRAELARRQSVVWTDKLGESKFNLSGVLQELPGRGAEALAEARAGVAALERALAFGVDSTLQLRLLILYSQEALVLDTLGRPAEAAPVSQHSIDLRRARLDAVPNDPARRRDLAAALVNHAAILAHAGRMADACAAARLAGESWRALQASGDLGARDTRVEVPAAAAAIALHCR